MNKKSKTPKRKRLKKPERLVAAKTWIKDYTGKNIIKGYKKWFGVDGMTALRELKLLGMTFTEKQEKDVENNLLARIKENKKRRNKGKEATNNLIESDEHFAYIVGYTEGGAPYGLTHEEYQDDLELVYPTELHEEENICIAMLEQTFFKLAAKYCRSTELIQNHWDEIKHCYSHKNRHYHTLFHLQNMLDQLSHVESQIYQIDAVHFAVFYHDIIYNPLKNNNEQKSAQLAAQRMQPMNVPLEIIEQCTLHILATQHHQPNDNGDTNYFTDADLCIVGQSEAAYDQYRKQIRQEYSIYPDMLYNPGRKKVLQHFLAMPAIYKTQYFQQHFEAQAKKNLQMELQGL